MIQLCPQIEGYIAAKDKEHEVLAIADAWMQHCSAWKPWTPTGLAAGLMELEVYAAWAAMLYESLKWPDKQEVWREVRCRMTANELRRDR